MSIFLERQVLHKYNYSFSLGLTSAKVKINICPLRNDSIK